MFAQDMVTVAFGTLPEPRPVAVAPHAVVLALAPPPTTLPYEKLSLLVKSPKTPFEPALGHVGLPLAMFSCAYDFAAVRIEPSRVVASVLYEFLMYCV